MSHTYIACDLGAESGRVILGHLEGPERRLILEEIHRFPTGAHAIGDTLHWDLPTIFEELKTGLQKASAIVPAGNGVSLSVDSWGVDYVLFHEGESAKELPHHYRDARTDAAYPAALACVSQEKIFAETGIQFMSINTLYQLFAELQQRPAALAAAGQFLNIADYLNYLFSGIARAEESLASTTQLYNPTERTWSTALIEAFGFPEALFPAITPSACLGTLTPEIATATGLAEETKVVATCSHDTGCAVAAVPAEEGSQWAYLSSGTWSLLGVELPEPLINEETRAANFTNEAGLLNTIRFLKNTAGLWILQECRREWANEGTEYNYDDLTRLAVEAAPLRSFINPGDARFLKPGAMPQRIVDFCKETDQPIPGTPGEFVRCILESLALLYRENLDILRKLTGRAHDTLHIVGGGSKNRLLNQLAADACGIPVAAGPVEATAIGNVLIQALALGHLESHDHLRRTVRASFPVESFQPTAHTPEWQNAIARYASFSNV